MSYDDSKTDIVFKEVLGQIVFEDSLWDWLPLNATLFRPGKL